MNYSYSIGLHLVKFQKRIFSYFFQNNSPREKVAPITIQNKTRGHFETKEIGNVGIKVKGGGK